MDRRLLGTTGGVKNNTIVFVNEKLLPELKRRINNGRDLTKQYTPAKLEAYNALVCSSSTPVSMPNGIVVVHDCITHFKADVIELDDTGLDQPSMKYIKDNLASADTIEMWHVWLTGGYYEYYERPVIHKYEATIADLTVEDIKYMDEAEIWNNRDKNRPSFYCLTISR